MHFFYADETGSTGNDLLNLEQPIFALGGISIRDQGWNATRREVEAAIEDYYAPSPVPEGFELHAHQLLSPRGEGPFTNHDRERRNGLVDTLLRIIDERRHDNVIVVIDKAELAKQGEADLTSRPHLTAADPYSLAFDQYVSSVEKHVRERLGHSARAMAIIDEHENYESVVDQVIYYRRHQIAKKYRVTWIVEFAHPVDSRRNPMIQLSDLIIYITRRFFEVDGGYRDDWSGEARNQYRDWYQRIHARRKNKSVVGYEDRYREPINELLASVFCKPSRGAFTSNA